MVQKKDYTHNQVTPYEVNLWRYVNDKGRTFWSAETLHSYDTFTALIAHDSRKAAEVHNITPQRTLPPLTNREQTAFVEILRKSFEGLLNTKLVPCKYHIDESGTRIKQFWPDLIDWGIQDDN